MARKTRRPEATNSRVLTPNRDRCWVCGGKLWADYRNSRTVATLDGLCQLTLIIRRCTNPDCELYHRPYRPEEEGAWVLPHGEFGLDIIALIGALRYAQHNSVPEIHEELQRRRVAIAERTVTNQLQRYEELVAMHLTDNARLLERLKEQGRIILAIDGLQPDVGNEMLWVLRDCLSGEVLLARSLLSATEADLAELLTEIKLNLPVSIHGVISDGQQSIRKAVQLVIPCVPHQLCQYHYLREAARPIYEADRHAKKELKKLVRGVRPIESKLEAREDVEAVATRGYCLAIRSALTDDGRPPLDAPGLKLYDRLQAIQSSIETVIKKGGPRLSLPA